MVLLDGVGILGPEAMDLLRIFCEAILRKFSKVQIFPILTVSDVLVLIEISTTSKIIAHFSVPLSHLVTVCVVYLQRLSKP